MNNKALFYFKKILFIILFVVFQGGYLYFFSWLLDDTLSFFHKLVRSTYLYDLFLDGESLMLILPVILVNFIITVLLWIFYRREISLYGRMLFSLAYAWDVAHFFLVDFVSSPRFKYLAVIIIAADIAIEVFLIKEALRYPKFVKAPDSAESEDKGDVPDDERQ